MVSDSDTCEKAALEPGHTLLREAEREPMVAGSPTYAFHALHCLTGRLDMYLIARGTGLQRFEQRDQAGEYHLKPGS